MTDQDERSGTEATARREAAGGVRPGRPSTSAIVVGISVVLGTVLLLWGADQLSRWAVQNLLARTVQQSTGVAARPSVQVQGAFILPQVLRGRYDDVTVTLAGLSSGPLRVAEVQSRLSGVHVPFHDVLLQSPGPVLIEQSASEAVLTYEDLERYLLVTGRPLTVDAAPDGEVLVTGTVQVLGRPIAASTRARLAARNGDLAVRPTELATGTALDEASRLLLGERFTFAVPLDPLPFGQEVTAVDVGEEGLLVRSTGRDVVIRR